MYPMQVQVRVKFVFMIKGRMKNKTGVFMGASLQQVAVQIDTYLEAAEAQGWIFMSSQVKNVKHLAG